MNEQISLFDLLESKNHISEIKNLLVDLLDRQQPSATELLEIIEEKIGLKARWGVVDAINQLISGSTLTNSNKFYLNSIKNDGSLSKALSGQIKDKKEIKSGINELLNKSRSYKYSSDYNEMIQFMGQFRDYAPYNNMLVRVQNPSCGFYATEKDWNERFKRTLIEDARPMIILAPMHPVMLVYDLDQTEGQDLPKEITDFSSFIGEWNPMWLENLIKNAQRYHIRVDFKTLSKTNGGFATVSRSLDDMKMRIVIHDQLDESSRFGVLCHELAHIFLGHLGTDKDAWWPSRINLSHSTVEIEAESVAYIITTQLKLSGSSIPYVSRHLGQNDKFPESVSMDNIAKVSGKLERMVKKILPKPKEKNEKKSEESEKK